MAPYSATAPLTELVLSSTASSSPLPTLSLHNPLTGALVYSFRAPTANTGTLTAGGAAKRKGAADEPEQSLEGRRTLAVVEGANGTGGFIAGLGGKDGRAALNVWNFTRVRPSTPLSGLRGGPPPPPPRADPVRQPARRRRPKAA